MLEERETWADYSKLVLKELERLNEGQEKMRGELENKFSEINQKISEAKNVEKTVGDQKVWMDKVTDVWSPTQMKEAKDEIYKQKSRWAAAIAIIIFLQIIIGWAIAVWKG
jgi:hypothetical protein